MIHVRCEEPRQLVCSVDGSRLNIRVDSEWRKIGRDRTLKVEEMNVKNILSFVGKVLNKVATDISAAGEHVYIDLPAEPAEELDLNSMSGDIEVEGCAARKIALHSTSGDITLNAPGTGRIERLSASSASGDIDIHADAVQAEAGSISGDVELEGEYQTARMKSTSGSNRLCGSAREVNARSVSGDITLYMKNPDVKRIDSSSTSGSVEIDLP